MEVTTENVSNETFNNNNNNNNITDNCNNDTTEVSTEILPLSSIEYVPAYCSRFSLCVLDTIRKLQQNSLFEKGVEKSHIVEYLKQLPNMDGDILSQVSIALRDLESNGYLMHLKNGYKTIGPFAKLCMAKTSRQRKILWKKLDMKFNHSYTDLSTLTSTNPINATTGGITATTATTATTAATTTATTTPVRARKCIRTRSQVNLVTNNNDHQKITSTTIIERNSENGSKQL